ncbi:MAG: hypothetical protein LBK68_06415 [Candidatus Margulisbacteria bacterium]|jgi:hypothetical protein|nr:hypothetical protein [Candidatus Margulisiibacteriota bacterium]
MNRKVVAEQSKEFKRGFGLGALIGLLFGGGGGSFFWLSRLSAPTAATTPEEEKSKGQETPQEENSLDSHKTSIVEKTTSVIDEAKNPIDDQETDKSQAAAEPVQTPNIPANPTGRKPAPLRDPYETLRQSFDVNIDLYLRRLANAARYKNAEIGKYRDILDTDQTLNNYLDDCVSAGLYKDKLEALRALENEILKIIE